MNFLDAIKSESPIRINEPLNIRCSGFFSYPLTSIRSNTWVDPEYLLSSIVLEKEILLSENWEVKPNYAAEIYAAVTKPFGSTLYSGDRSNSYRDAIKEIEEILIKVKNEKM